MKWSVSLRPLHLRFSEVWERSIIHKDKDICIWSLQVDFLDIPFLLLVKFGSISSSHILPNWSHHRSPHQTAEQPRPKFWDSCLHLKRLGEGILQVPKNQVHFIEFVVVEDVFLCSSFFSQGIITVWLYGHCSPLRFSESAVSVFVIVDMSRLQSLTP